MKLISVEYQMNLNANEVAALKGTLCRQMRQGTVWTEHTATIKEICSQLPQDDGYDYNCKDCKVWGT